MIILVTNHVDVRKSLSDPSISNQFLDLETMQKQAATKAMLPLKLRAANPQGLQLLNPLVAHTVEVKNIFPVINIDHSHVSFEVAIRPNVKSLLQCKIETMVVGEETSQIQTIVINSSDVTVLRFVIGVDETEKVG